ncbi:MAG: hypothetical protein HZB13_00715 [Acidobacteria bacterium]|nr:hypothetical protein [Acidobacteriota bacterium]
MLRWLLFPALTMSLGWGLRGFIGGGPLGAMIPGAMLALCLALLLKRDGGEAGLLAAFGAVGVGFGGQETYGQTVGLSFQPETFWWAITGFAIKGAAWGLLGGAFLAMALRRPARRELAAGLGLMVAGTWAGWITINHPKLVYFSNRVDKPREELWAGLLLGGLLLLLWMSRRGGARLLWRFAGWGALGGGAGFALGAAIQAWGRPTGMKPWIDWWKIMELTFGALLGMAYGWAAHRSRTELGASQGKVPRLNVPWSLVAAVVLALVGIGLEYSLKIRFGYTVAGSLLLAAALWSELISWQAAITVTCCAFFMDLHEAKPAVGVWAGWVAVVVASAVVAWVTALQARAREMFLLLTWCAVGVSVLKVALPPGHWSVGGFVMEASFVAMAAGCTWWAIRGGGGSSAPA